MSRQTIDFGIDLGTTNSAISLLTDVKPEIIKNNDDIDITASAVYIGKSGQVVVGNRAKNRLEQANSVHDVYTEFKREIGSDRIYTFKSAGLQKTPVDLSAEVLKDLKGNVQLKLGEDLQAAVVTIPAAFAMAQCNATKRAAELAGFKQCPLLQEPVAASLAYGFQGDTSTKDMWLVFDFGGGTFDAAIMKANEGDLQVVSHGGDNYLGGSDIDFGILDKIIIPRLQESFNLPDFTRGNERWSVAMARMKRMIEEAKIELSRKEAWPLDNCSFEDADGNLVDFEELNITLTRNSVIEVVEPLIERAAERCRAVLKGAGLGTADMSKVLLVGGPTKAPYFRDILKSKLDIPLDFSVDPLTVVSSGAAIFAGTQKIEKTGTVMPPPSGACSLELTYNPQGPDEDPRVTGAATGVGVSLEGATIEFVNRKTHWTSGKIALNDEGMFKLRLRAEKGYKNYFDIILTDATGTKIKTDPAEIAYTIGMVLGGGQIVTNTISVALADNKIQEIVAKKTPYPFRETCRDLKTVVACRKGTDDKIEIPVLEGLNGDAGVKADHNRKLGTLVITGKQVPRDVPIGSNVEVTLKAKEPGMLMAVAYIDVLDEEYSAQIDFAGGAPTVDSLKKQLADERKHANAADGVPDEIAQKLNEGEEKIDGAKDGVVAKQCETLLIEARVALDEAEKVAKVPKMKEDIQKLIDDGRKFAEELNNDEYLRKADQIEAKWSRFVNSTDAKEIEEFQEEVKDFYFGMILAQPGFWVAELNEMKRMRNKMSNPSAADELYAQGARDIQRNNLKGLQNTVRELWNLLPPGDRATRGFNGGLTR